MKKLPVFLLLMILTLCSYSQPNSVTPSRVKIDYLEKSRHQKVASGILLGGGFLCMTLGGQMGGKSASGFSRVVGGVLMISGATAVFSSVPLFVISFATKSKMKMSVGNQMIPRLQNSSFVYNAAPSLTLKFGL